MNKVTVIGAGNVGATVAECVVRKDMVHQSLEAFRGWLRTAWHPYTDRLPETERGSFITAVATRYLRTHPMDSEGRTHVAMVRLEIEATWA